MSICAETPSGANGAAAPPLPSVTGGCRTMWPAWEKTEFETGGVVSTGFPSLFTIAKWKNCKSSHRKPGTADSESEARWTPAAKADFGARPAVCEAPFLSLSGSPGPARPALPSRPCTPPPRSPSLLESDADSARGRRFCLWTLCLWLPCLKRHCRHTAPSVPPAGARGAARPSSELPPNRSHPRVSARGPGPPCAAPASVGTRPSASAVATRDTRACPAGPRGPPPTSVNSHSRSEMSRLQARSWKGEVGGRVSVPRRGRGMALGLAGPPERPVPMGSGTHGPGAAVPRSEARRLSGCRLRGSRWTPSACRAPGSCSAGPGSLGWGTSAPGRQSGCLGGGSGAGAFAAAWSKGGVLGDGARTPNVPPVPSGQARSPALCVSRVLCGAARWAGSSQRQGKGGMALPSCPSTPDSVPQCSSIAVFVSTAASRNPRAASHHSEGLRDSRSKSSVGKGCYPAVSSGASRAPAEEGHWSL